MAGVLLSDSEYRHEVQADIAPFEGLLLGLFFVSVGMGADVAALMAEPLRYLSLALGLMVLKAGALFGLARLSGLRPGGSARHSKQTDGKPVDCTIVGIVDSVQIGGDTVFEKYPLEKSE